MASAPAQGEDDEAMAEEQSDSPWLTDTPFRLFDLPRELRDHIYDYSLAPLSTFKVLATHRPAREDAEDMLLTMATPHSSLDLATRPSPPVPGLLASVRFRPRTNMLLGNTTLKREYEGRAKLAITLVLRDNENYAFQPINLPEPAKEVYWAELHLILFCHSCRPAHADERGCQATHEIMHHRGWIEKLLSSQLQKLRSFSANVYLCYDYYRPSAKKSGEKVPCEPFVLKKIQDLVGLPKLKTLQLYKYNFHDKPSLDGPKELLFQWPPKPESEKAEKNGGSGKEDEKAEDGEAEDAVDEDADVEDADDEAEEAEGEDAEDQNAEDGDANEEDAEGENGVDAEGEQDVEMSD